MCVVMLTCWIRNYNTIDNSKIIVWSSSTMLKSWHNLSVNEITPTNWKLILGWDNAARQTSARKIDYSFVYTRLGEKREQVLREVLCVYVRLGADCWWQNDVRRRCLRYALVHTYICRNTEWKEGEWRENGKRRRGFSIRSFYEKKVLSHGSSLN